jgi:SAM-dependent methyltransferase
MSRDSVHADVATLAGGGIGPAFEPLVDRSGPTVRIDRRTMRRVARARSSEHNIVSIVVRQAFHEARVRFLRKRNYRSRDNGAALRAYGGISADDLRGINARQRWANWRVIPQNLGGLLPSGPVRAIDLCCGVGDSTEVLAYYLAPGSDILGIEFNPAFIAAAMRREYLDERGRPAAVRFRAQSVLDTFRDTLEQPLADGSIDLVSSCGAVGCHFDPAATARLLDEVTRVLRRGGLATIDSGADGTEARDLIRLGRARGLEAVHRARSCALDRFEQIAMVKI